MGRPEKRVAVVADVQLPTDLSWTDTPTQEKGDD